MVKLIAKKTEEAQEKWVEPKIEKSPYLLVVKTPFRNFKKGDRISDAQQVANILGCHEKNMVVKIQNRGQ